MALVDTLGKYEELIKSGFKDEQAKGVAKVIETSFEEYRQNQKEFLVTKEEFKVAIAELRAELKEDIANLRAELIKWMFIFWVGQIGAMIAIFAIMKK